MTDRYYEPEDDDEGDYIDERYPDLMKTDDYSPYDWGNIQEALSEECLQAHKDAFIEAMENGKHDVLGLIVNTSIYEYWEAQAREAALREFQQGV